MIDYIFDQILSLHLFSESIEEKLQADFEFPTRIIRPYRMHKEKTQSDVLWFNRVNGSTKN